MTDLIIAFIALLVAPVAAFYAGVHRERRDWMGLGRPWHQHNRSLWLWAIVSTAMTVWGLGWVILFATAC